MNYSEKYAQTLKEYLVAHHAEKAGDTLLSRLHSIERRGLHTPTETERKALSDCHSVGLKPTVN